MGPRDAPTKWGIPVNLATGQPFTDMELARIEKLQEAEKALRDVMHQCEGSDPENPRFQTRLMAIAATQLEIATTMAIKAVSTGE